MPTIAYLRVSTAKQNLDKNKSEILLFAHQKGLEPVKFVEEVVSGRLSWKKRTLFTVIESLSEDDNLIISELSRLGRSMVEIMEVLAVAIEKKINVYAIKGNWQLDNTLQSKIMAMVFSMAAEIERDLISKRTKEALQARKAAGIKLGRPKGKGYSKLDKYKPEIEALLKNGSTQKFIAQRYNTTPSNLHHWLKQQGLR